jgi:hypothetical protein
MAPVQVHQIFYDEVSRQALDPSFIPLDNRANARPDWREYWPIRQHLLTHSLDENALHGFFSWKFGAKTSLRGEQVIRFAAASERDVVLFSPFVEQASFFLNIFEHGEANHPGLLPAMQAFVDDVGLGVNLAHFVSDHSRTVFSNFFVATPRFWREWLHLGERLFAACETPGHPIGRLMAAQARYHAAAGEVELKVFVVERLASLLLHDGRFSSVAYDPFALERTGIPASFLDEDMRIANGLKLAFIQSGDAKYLDSFHRTRGEVMQRLQSPRTPGVPVHG